MSDKEGICTKQEVDLHSDVELLVGGKSIPMVPFVADMFREVIRAMVGTLSGTDPDAEIRITVGKKE